MGVTDPRRTTHNAGRVDCREYAGSCMYHPDSPLCPWATQLECQPAIRTRHLKVNSLRSRDWRYASNGRKQKRSAIRRKSRYGSTPKSESLRILKRAGRAECWEHRERSRGKRGTYDSAMPLSFPAIEQLRYLWGGPPGLRPTPRRPVAGVKELDLSSGERVQGDPPRPGPDQGSAARILAAVRTSVCATSS